MLQIWILLIVTFYVGKIRYPMRVLRYFISPDTKPTNQSQLHSTRLCVVTKVLTTSNHNSTQATMNLYYDEFVIFSPLSAGQMRSQILRHPQRWN